MTDEKPKHDHELQERRTTERNALRGSAKQIVRKERARQKARRKKRDGK